MKSGGALLSVAASLASVASAKFLPILPPASCEFAVELSYLQDFSQSYDDDTKQLTSDQLKAIFKSIEVRYPESRFSVGSFVDKPLVEFGYPALDWWGGDWCLDIQDKLDNGKSVDALVDDFFLQPDGGGYDFPENQLGALHDVARVGEKVGWTTGNYTPGGKPIVRMMVMTTNSIYHVAGDGLDSTYKLTPNNGIDETDCTKEDYPSVAQVESALKDRGAYTYFLVGDRFPEEKIYESYQELANLMPEADVSVYGYEREDTEGLIQAFRELFDRLEREICEATLDVMFAQDVTWSYSNDMPNFQPRMHSLMQKMADKYPESRFGMTTFGDKPLMPLGHGGSGDYCYRVESVLTEDRSLVEAAANKVTTTSGIDWRESQLDGLISSALDPSLGWRAGDYWEGKMLERFVFIATDSGYHRAGDAAKAGYELASHTGGLMTDELCATMEYPTVEQMALAVKAAGVFPVFVPTSDIVSIYRILQKTLKDVYDVESEVVELKDFDGDLVAAVNHTVAKVVSGRPAHSFLP